MMWKLNNTLLSSQSRKKILREIRKYFEINENDTSYQNLCDATKAVPTSRGKFIPVNAYIKK